MQRETLIKHFGPEWADFMAPFAGSEAFSTILDTLKKEKAEGKVVYPEAAAVFRAFRETPLSQVRVVLLGQDPYPKEGYSTGIAFGHAKNLKIAPSLEKIVDAIEVDVYDGLQFEKPNFDTTLESWTKQGILCLNTALTVVDQTPGSHAELWKPFTEFVIERLNTIGRNVIWLAWGAQSQNFAKAVNVFEHFVFSHEHPAKAAREKKPWDCKHFSLVNACIIKNRLGETIKW